MLLWAFLYMSFGVYTYAILWGLYLDSRHACVWVRYFWYFPKCLYQLILPPALYQSFSVLTLGILCSFPFNSGSAVISNWVLIGITVITNKSWVPFICLLTIWISSLWSACPSFLLNFSIVLLKISNGFKGCYFFFFFFCKLCSMVQETFSYKWRYNWPSTVYQKTMPFPTTLKYSFCYESSDCSCLSLF